MKIFSLFVPLIIAIAGLGNANQESEVDRMKSDLVGKGMGGREKCWYFQSTDQIKECIIQNKTEDAQKRVYSISLELQDSRVPGKYKADAQVVYEKVGNEWKVKHVGLISIEKIE